MRTINRTAKFKKDFKREARGQHRQSLDAVFKEVVFMLANDQPLPEKYRDHVLVGNYRDCGECHLKPDWLLIYRKPDNETLELVRLGSHSELF